MSCARGYGVRDRGITGDHLERLTGRAGLVEDREQYRRDVFARDALVSGFVGDCHPPSPRIVGQETGTHDR